MRLVLLESPYRGKDEKETEENVRYARACMRDCLLRDEAPFASHLLYTQEGILDDKIPSERELGIDAGLLWGEHAEATVVYVDRGISEGMKQGIRSAMRCKRPVERRSIGVGILLPQERTANIETHVCDQGHYGSSWCGACNHDLSQLIPTPEYCPNCHVKLLWGVPTCNRGGSDF